jgi:hypothetical protein
MLSTNQENTPHPLELLEAYALTALDDDEWEDVDLHLDACSQCSQQVAQMQAATYIMGQSVPMLAPPPGLKEQVLQALPSRRIAPAAPSPATRSFPVTPRPNPAARLTRALLPLAAGLVLGLFGTAMFINMSMANRMERLETVSLEMIQRMDESATGDNQALGEGQAVQPNDMLKFDPRTPPLVLESPSGARGRHGFMLVTEDGRRAVLMVAGMKEPRPPWGYNIWLTRGGQRVPLGRVNIDSSGSGTMTLTPPEPLFRFDSLNVTMDRETAEPTSPGEMVLQTKFAGRR